MKKLIVAAVLLSGCTFNEQIVRRAQIRSYAESQLSVCLWEVGNSIMFRRQCIRESVEFCRANGLEASCGTDGLATQTGLR